MWAQATGGSANFPSHGKLPESQESREVRLPGRPPAWVEGTGAKEETVSDGWVPRQEAGHGPTGIGWRSIPVVQLPRAGRGHSEKGDGCDGEDTQGRPPSPAQR